MALICDRALNFRFKNPHRMFVSEQIRFIKRDSEKIRYRKISHQLTSRNLSALFPRRKFSLPEPELTVSYFPTGNVHYYPLLHHCSSILIYYFELLPRSSLITLLTNSWDFKTLKIFFKWFIIGLL